jgi:DNA helicase-2/ATP-dependent DNA helicase PcrA
MFQARHAGRGFSEEELVAAFRRAWVSEGFLSREHEEHRLRAGEQALRRFHREEAQHPWNPTGIEEAFNFAVGRNRVSGRFDLVIARDGFVTIVDFKTGDVDAPAKADERVRKSLQLDIYALAHLRARGRLPDRVELRFLETGLSAGRQPTLEQAAATEAVIREVGAGIRQRAFPARPAYMACMQCAFRDICPHTAWGGRVEDERRLS